MNRIQEISREIETRNLKLQMGIDPTVDIDHETVRHMWRELNLERLKTRLHDELTHPGHAALPDEPAFLDEVPPRSN